MARKKQWKPTEEQQEERIALAVDCIAHCVHKHQIKEALRKLAEKQMPEAYNGKREELSARTIETYISRARDRMASQGAQSAGDRFRSIVAYYESVLRNPKASIREKLEAQRELARMYGVDQPGRVLFNPNPEKAVVDTEVDERETRPAVLKSLEVVYGSGREAV